MLPFASRNNYNIMSSQDEHNKENSSENLPAVKGEPLKPRAPSKAIRLLTVIAYVLSVSMAAIFLSIYYIFIWKDKALVSAEPFNCTASSLTEFVNFTTEEPEEITEFGNTTIMHY